MGILIRIGGLKLGSSRGASVPAAIKAKFLFWGKVSDISGGQMPNKVTGATDHLDVTGSPATYVCPNTAPYIAADHDHDSIWFKTDETPRTTTTAELIGYDFARTLVKYDNATPYTIREIIILKDGETLTTTEMNFMRDYMDLSIWWSNVLSIYGYLKGNRGTVQSVWTAEVIGTNPVVLSAVVAHVTPTLVEITFDQALDESSVPATSAFALADKTISNVAISGAVVTLTVTEAYVYADTVTVAYTKPGANTLKDAVNGLEVETFTGQAVNNSIHDLVSLLAWYKLEESSGTDADDASTNHFDGVIGAGCAWTTTHKIGSRALSFAGGATSMMSIDGIGGGQYAGNFAISMWVYLTTNGYLVAYGKGTESPYYSFGIISNVFTYYNGASTTKTFGTVPLNEWVHLVWVVRQEEADAVITFYVNGVPSTPQQGTGKIIQNVSNDKTAVGNNLGGSYGAVGIIDDLMFYNKELNQAQVTRLCNNIK
jgi:hypothetical protein